MKCTYTFRQRIETKGWKSYLQEMSWTPNCMYIRYFCRFSCCGFCILPAIFQHLWLQFRVASGGYTAEHKSLSERQGAATVWPPNSACYVRAVQAHEQCSNRTAELFLC